jgi:uncharacterized membrane protein
MKDIEALELRVAKFLRAGVIVAGSVILCGFLMGLSSSGNPFLKFQAYSPIPFSDLVRQNYQAREWSGLVTYLGLMVLISLPIIRVFLTAIIFMRQKEKLLSLIALTVLIGLLISLFMGFEL